MQVQQVTAVMRIRPRCVAEKMCKWGEKKVEDVGLFNTLTVGRPCKVSMFRRKLSDATNPNEFYVEGCHGATATYTDCLWATGAGSPQPWLESVGKGMRWFKFTRLPSLTDTIAELEDYYTCKCRGIAGKAIYGIIVKNSPCRQYIQSWMQSVKRRTSLADSCLHAFTLQRQQQSREYERQLRSSRGGAEKNGRETMSEDSVRGRVERGQESRRLQAADLHTTFLPLDVVKLLSRVC